MSLEWREENSLSALGSDPPAHDSRHGRIAGRFPTRKSGDIAARFAKQAFPRPSPSGVPWQANFGRWLTVDAKKPKPSAQDLLADWRTAERVGKTARSAAESAGLAVESADSAKAAAASAQAAVAGAAEAVDRAKEASDLASVAAAQASEAAQQVYAEAQEDVERTSEIVREATALEVEAGDAFREAQRQDFAKERE